MKNVFLLFGVLGLCALAPTPGHAQSAYSWTAEDGKTVYGTKPPPGAKDVNNLGKRSFSRYSSKKMLKRMGYKRAALKKGEAEEARKKPVYEQPIYVINDSGAVTRFEVNLFNPSKKRMEEVGASVEFIDGTLLPLKGPKSLSAGDSARFELPPEILPLKLQTDEETAKRSPVLRIGVQGKTVKK